MNRRDYLTGLIPLTAVTAGCTVLYQSEPRDLWTVSVDSVDIDEIDLTVEVRRQTATTEQLATVWVEFLNTLDEPIRLAQITGPYHSNTFHGLVLISMEEDVERESSTCWKPAGNPHGDGGYYTWKVPAGESWSILHGIWVDDDATCPPEGTFTFSGVAEADLDVTNRDLDWEFSLVAEPVVRTTTT